MSLTFDRDDPNDTREVHEGERIRIVWGGREVVVNVEAVSNDGRTVRVSEVVGGE